MEESDATVRAADSILQGQLPSEQYHDTSQILVQGLSGVAPFQADDVSPKICVDVENPLTAMKSNPDDRASRNLADVAKSRQISAVDESVHKIQLKASVEFSPLDIITFSKDVTDECLAVVRSKDASCCKKVWSIFKIINNFMNREQFFYIDHAICIGFSIYNYVAVHVMSAFDYYTIGMLGVNCTFLWYFSYCRYLNGKDIITLRRSIQLLSHGFQITTVGLIILCHAEDNVIYDDEHHQRHQFVCTQIFLLSNLVRVAWHLLILFKSFLDEILGNFLITRGVVIDIITIFTAPGLISLSLITDITSSDVHDWLVKSLRVDYEVNNITTTTPFYRSLDTSEHKNKLEPVIFFLTLLSSDMLGGMQYYDDQVLPSTEFTCAEEKFIPSYFGLLVMVALTIGMGWSLMVEYCLCKQLKACNVFMFLITNVASRLYGLYTLREYEICLWANYAVIGSASNIHTSWYRLQCCAAVLSVGMLIIYVYYNWSIVRRKQGRLFLEYITFVAYVLCYCPLLPLYQYFVVPVAIKTTTTALSLASGRSLSMTVMRSTSNVGQTFEMTPRSDHIEAAPGEKHNEDITVNEILVPDKNMLAKAVDRFIIFMKKLLRRMLSVIVCVPLILLCLITDYCAVDLQRTLNVCLGVVHEETNIFMHSEFYKSLSCSRHRNKLEPILFFLILLTVDLITFADDVRYQSQTSEFVNGQTCDIYGTLPQASRMRGITGLLFVKGFFLVVEFYFCNQIKMCNCLGFLSASLLARCYFLGQYRTYETYSSCDDSYETHSSLRQSWYMRQLGVTGTTIIILSIFLYDNRVAIRERNYRILSDYVQFYIFLAFYCPLAVVVAAVWTPSLPDKQTEDAAVIAEAITVVNGAVVSPVVDNKGI
jgi:hypothetical protein